MFVLHNQSHCTIILNTPTDELHGAMSSLKRWWLFT